VVAVKCLKPRKQAAKSMLIGNTITDIRIEVFVFLRKIGNVLVDVARRLFRKSTAVDDISAVIMEEAEFQARSSG
jgi:uncharacterized protein YdeI (BOF family)